jgi:hypothetical protein
MAHSPAPKLPALNQRQDLARLRVPAERQLGEYQSPVDGHLEGTAGRFPELELSLGKRLLELGDQTGRPWLIASNDAVFDADVHLMANR